VDRQIEGGKVQGPERGEANQTLTVGRVEEDVTPNCHFGAQGLDDVDIDTLSCCVAIADPICHSDEDKRTANGCVAVGIEG
jgi:hypothetical protein